MSLSDISDLTDLSSDEPDVPLARSTSKVKKLSKEYKITHVLRAPRTAQYTAKSLYDQIIDNSIDLDPDYQRDVVWQEEKQSGLIDSILRNYYIPPIIFAVTVQDDGSEMRTCIDGKQRLTSIQRFIDGQIPHRDSFTSEKLWFKSSATNGRRKLLPQHLRTLFTNKQIVCVEYTGLNDDQEREIFQRVQLGVALTPAERLQALVGPWSTVIHEIQNQVLGEEGFEGYLDWGHTRGRDFQCLASIGYLVESYPKTVVPGTKTLEKWLQKMQPVSNQLRSDLRETLRIFVTLARDKKYSGSLNRPTRVSPIEFVMIALLIYLKRQALSFTQISSAIEKMRKDVRASHQDIRSNTRVAKHLVEFMTKKIKVSELKSDGEGDKPAALAVAKATKSAKRKRPAHSDESDSEFNLNVKAQKQSTDPLSLEAVKSSKEASNKGTPKINGVKKTTSPPVRASVTAKPAPPPATSSRMTNNSLAALVSAQTPKPPLLVPASQASRRQSPPPPPPPPSPPNPPPPNLNDNNTQSGLIPSKPARDIPVVAQIGSTVKAESPQTTTFSPTVPMSAADRLAPIRAAKASLSGTDTQLPVSTSNESKVMPSPATSMFQVPDNLLPNHVIPPTSSQQPMPPTFQALTQRPAIDTVQERPIHPQLGEVLRVLRSQFPQLGTSAQSTSNGPVSPATFGPSMQPNGLIGQSIMSPTNSGFGNIGGPNNPGQTSPRYGISTPQGSYNGGMQAHLNQTSRSYTTSPWPSSGSGTPGNVNSQQHSTKLFSSSANQYGLPPRPTGFANTPSSSMRAEPLGPPPRSASSEGPGSDNWRGSYTSERRRSSDDRRPNGYERNFNSDRNKRPWHRP